MLLILERSRVLHVVKATQVKPVLTQNPREFRRFLATRNSKEKNHYKVLRVSESATPKEIRAAFVKLSKELHPDKNPNNPRLHDEFVAINEAYTVLSKAASRREYDINLSSEAYRRSYTAKEASHSRENEEWNNFMNDKEKWNHFMKENQRMNHFMNDTAYRNHFHGPPGGFNKPRYNDTKLALFISSILLGLGTLYLCAAYWYSVKRLEEKRVQGVRRLKELQNRPRSRQEVLALLAERSEKNEARRASSEPHLTDLEKNQ